MDLINKIDEFRAKFGLPLSSKGLSPEGYEKEARLLISNLSEEADEVYQELFGWSERTNKEICFDPRDVDRASLLKELADVLYVTAQIAGFFNLPLELAFNRVHENNMSKVDEFGNVRRGPNGKVLKPHNYKPVDLSDLV
jgi:predicted HAD superfamily Cof-like phosphohydrolase